ncbi:alpha/beta hydrolase [Polymorphobacter fuscus]|uniref:Alpha/beta hydrolase n=1 Tax=Sandarakinorhabdus fusca TaxID=1439888 RepID=A0A7C9LH25_9SPHN|nr:alpha/beta fold hydrolase [Polymorphobacter fuscus]KAB7645495.1 alpha/beta hydrolase [Polymorphobacter fuscus]MQT17927.1 alpha/beta hydrolase [Polymorphobacter fuscus]NJC08557.1 alpha-beta hydrolase superfamily lysophospholipase [Polymorphobacter fuscus]
MATRRSLPARLLRWVAVAAAAVLLLVIGGTFTHAWLMAPAAPIAAWHTRVPPELDAAAIDATDWKGYLAAEDRAFAFVDAEVTQRLPPGDRLPINRYFRGSPIYPPRLVRNWNRSFVLEPAGPSAGVVVLLHGLTDAPYSLRHVALLYQARGWTAIGIRMPAHGTVPAALTKARWQEWTAATRLAMREARRRAGTAPIDIIGYSNGGALAMHHALAAAADPSVPQARRIVLLSPMIGLTEFARFAGVAGWPAVFPAFAKAAWLDIVPEYNPFKYNSFPVNAARESFALTAALRDTIDSAIADGSIRRLPPVLTFQSLVDSTVSTPAVVHDLYDHLPANGSELVIFDINRHADFGPMLRPAVAGRLATMLPTKARPYRVTILTNAAPDVDAVVERTTAAGATTAVTRPLDLAFPPQIYSLTHIALPFPASDGLYGAAPDPGDAFGVHLGTLAARGERGTLSISLDTLLRLSWNPFFPYLADRVAPTAGAAS